MFIADDASAKVNNLTVICSSGRFFNWSDTLGKVLRLVDLGVTCDRFGLFSGVNSFMRLTNVSPTAMTTNGALFTGSFGAFQYQSSLANITNGTLLDLGSATFVSFRVANVISNISAGTTFLSGLVSSGNIEVGGTGSLLGTSITGAGTRLNNISPNDVRWQFLLNDDISDTRPDLLLSMQGNATVTTITVINTPVLVAGTWITKTSSQMTVTAAGRSTYNGGKDAKLPITYSVSVEPVTGNNIAISAYVAIDGVVDTDSKRAGTATAGSPQSLTIPWQITFSTDTFVEVFVENNDTTSDILVSSAISRVN